MRGSQLSFWSNFPASVSETIAMPLRPLFRKTSTKNTASAELPVVLTKLVANTRKTSPRGGATDLSLSGREKVMKNARSRGIYVDPDKPFDSASRDVTQNRYHESMTHIMGTQHLNGNLVVE